MKHAKHLKLVKEAVWTPGPQAGSIGLRKAETDERILADRVASVSATYKAALLDHNGLRYETYGVIYILLLIEAFSGWVLRGRCTLSQQPNNGSGAKTTGSLDLQGG